mmetsp:Transcript_3312/g.5175  ORF Transcript_3312/g.5175 Transcript_3312/m.5175 type:complete len:467 (-) Transcript_3312:126-1526(-)
MHSVIYIFLGCLVGVSSISVDQDTTLLIDSQDSADSTDSLFCPSPYTSVGDSCYYLSDDVALMYSANRSCHALNGWLVAIETQSESDSLYEWVSEYYVWDAWFDGPYIGLYRYDLSDYVFEWMYAPARGSEYTNWVEGAPSVITGTDNCVLMTNKKGGWYNYYCDTQLRYICETDPVSAIPTIRPTPYPTPRPSQFHYTHQPTPAPTPLCTRGFYWAQGGCYSLGNVPMTWEAANSSCASDGGWLATPVSVELTSSLVDWLATYDDLSWDSESGLFIGLREDKDGEFRWIHSEEEVSSYAPWVEGYPMYPTGLEHCVSLTSEGLWVNTPCEEEHQYVCQSKAVTYTKSEDTSSSTTARTVLLSLFIPLCLFVGAMLFYFCVIREKRPTTDWVRCPFFSGKVNRFSRAFGDDEEDPAASTHALVSREMTALSPIRGGYDDGSSPEETMEIQLQMRSPYTAVSQNGSV